MRLIERQETTGPEQHHLLCHVNTDKDKLVLRISTYSVILSHVLFLGKAFTCLLLFVCLFLGEPVRP